MIPDLFANSAFSLFVGTIIFIIGQKLLHGAGTWFCLIFVLASVYSCVWTLPVVAKSPNRKKHTRIVTAVFVPILFCVGLWSTRDEDSLEPSDRAFVTLASVGPLPNDSLAAHVEIKNDGHLTAKDVQIYVRLFGEGNLPPIDEERFFRERPRQIVFDPNSWEPGHTVGVDIVEPEFLDESFLHNPEFKQFYVIFMASYVDKNGQMFVERCIHAKPDLQRYTRCMGHNNAYLKRPSYWPQSDDGVLSRIRRFYRRIFASKTP